MSNVIRIEIAFELDYLDCGIWSNVKLFHSFFMIKSSPIKGCFSFSPLSGRRVVTLSNNVYWKRRFFYFPIPSDQEALVSWNVGILDHLRKWTMVRGFVGWM